MLEKLQYEKDNYLQEFKENNSIQLRDWASVLPQKQIHVENGILLALHHDCQP